jgi:hypothetical protein
VFIIERRGAGVLAALALSAAVAVLGNIRDRADEVPASSAPNPTAAFRDVDEASGTIAFLPEDNPDARTASRELPCAENPAAYEQGVGGYCGGVAPDIALPSVSTNPAAASQR